jgi:plasmid maintenance system killer protein
VYIEFKARRLERCYRERRVREAAWGKAVAHKYVQAVELLKAADHPSDLRRFRSLNYHPLTADR